MSRRPPRLAEWLVGQLVDDDAAEAVIGDLAEGFRRETEARGRCSATTWYWRQAARSVLTCRVTGRRRSDERWPDVSAGPATVRDRIRPLLRQARTHPLHTATTLLTLTLAIGVATASMAIARHALMAPLPYAHEDSLVSLLTAGDGGLSAVSVAVLDDLQAAGAPLADYASVRPSGVAVRGDAGNETVSANYVTPAYFHLLGVQVALGRPLADGDTDAVVLSHGYWQRALGSDTGVLGRRILVNDRPHTVVGVLANGFMPLYWPACELWMPLDLTALRTDPTRGRRTLTVLARRADGRSQADVDAFLAAFSLGLQRQYPAVHGRQAWVARPLRDELVGESAPALLAAAGGALLLVLVVASNIAGLASARAVASRHDLAVRMALGATRGRLFMESLIDSLIIAATGTVAGLWLAHALVTLLAVRQSEFLGRLEPVRLDLVTVIAGLAAGLAIGVVAALVPRGIIGAALRDVVHATRAPSASGPAPLRGGIVVGQVALAVVLLVGAGLIVRSAVHLMTLPLGFDPAELTTFPVNLSTGRYSTPEAQLAFEDAVVDRLSALPSVRHATASVGIPVIGGMMAALSLHGRPDDQERDEVAYMSLAPGFFSAIGARLVAGRDFTAADHLGAPRVAVVNVTMARQFWPAGDALGARIQLGPGDPGGEWITVVGIVEDIRQHGPTARVLPTAFGSTRQYSWPRRNFVIRTSGNGAPGLAIDIRHVLREVDPALAAGTVTPIAQLVAERTAPTRLMRLVLGLFAVVAVVLCGSGLYAVVTITSRMRRREYAIRLAMGAPRSTVRRLVLGQSLRLAAMGVLIGLAASALSTRALAGVLFGVSPTDPASFAAAAAVPLVLSLAAAWLPARAAERADPAMVLKGD